MKVNEIFGPTIQGEGKSIGARAMFLRLAGCNLRCSWCDTKYALDWERYDPAKEIHELSCIEIVDILKRQGPKTKKLVISGGEPMLQQAELIELLKMLKENGYWVEIETNGTIGPTDEFFGLIDQINCSPKTKNSGQNLVIREKSEALNLLVASTKTNFKFVVCGENDLPEIEEFIRKYGIDKGRAYLMSEGATREEYFNLDGTELSRDTRVMKMAYQNGFMFSSRLQVFYWDGKRGF